MRRVRTDLPFLNAVRTQVKLSIDDDIICPPGD